MCYDVVVEQELTDMTIGPEGMWLYRLGVEHGNTIDNKYDGDLETFLRDRERDVISKTELNLGSIEVMGTVDVWERDPYLRGISHYLQVVRGRSLVV